MSIELEQIAGVSDIDWTNPNSKISKYFCVKDALFLPRWNRIATKEDGLTDIICGNLLDTFIIMDRIQALLPKDKKIRIHNAYRPPKYNILIGGATKSMHMEGLAVDFSSDADQDGDVDGSDCDQIKRLVMPYLKDWMIRMEDNGWGAGWVHIDLKAVWLFGNRFFKP